MGFFASSETKRQATQKRLKQFQEPGTHGELLRRLEEKHQTANETSQKHQAAFDKALNTIPLPQVLSANAPFAGQELGFKKLYVLQLALQNYGNKALPPSIKKLKKGLNYEENRQHIQTLVNELDSKTKQTFAAQVENFHSMATSTHVAKNLQADIDELNDLRNTTDITPENLDKVHKNLERMEHMSKHHIAQVDNDQTVLNNVDLPDPPESKSLSSKNLYREHLLGIKATHAGLKALNELLQGTPDSLELRKEYEARRKALSTQIKAFSEYVNYLRASKNFVAHKYPKHNDVMQAVAKLDSLIRPSRIPFIDRKRIYNSCKKGEQVIEFDSTRPLTFTYSEYNPQTKTVHHHYAAETEGCTQADFEQAALELRDIIRAANGGKDPNALSTMALDTLGAMIGLNKSRLCYATGLFGNGHDFKNGHLKRVRCGNPETRKLLLELMKRARDQRLEKQNTQVNGESQGEQEQKAAANWLNQGRSCREASSAASSEGTTQTPSSPAVSTR